MICPKVNLWTLRALVPFDDRAERRMIQAIQVFGLQRHADPSVDRNALVQRDDSYDDTPLCATLRQRAQRSQTEVS